MALTPGTRLGVYDITAQIGAGGMGEVYRATDSNLKRSVAIKVLPAFMAGDVERLARFQREAEVLAALNHPNIGAIYGLEKAPDFTGLIMELVEGDDLSQRIARGAISLDEALPLARQIAEALEAAHEQGIVHRDLKPANIKVRPDGTVKVLDFGLAKAMEPATAGVPATVTVSPTITSPAMLTGVGTILGTAAYMSPEQAKGRAADKRSDVWSFGCVLFEMLAGTRAFEAEDVSDTLAMILKGEPDWTRLPADVPASIRTLITRCLEKDRRQRIGDIAVARYVLGDRRPAETDGMKPIAAAKARSPRTAIAAALAGAAIAGGAAWALKPRAGAPAAAPTRFTIPLVAGQPVEQLASSRHVMALSPDGSRLAYVAGGQIFVRAMNQLEMAPIRGVSDGPIEPVFSPDGQWIAYFASGHLKKIAVVGGAPMTICDIATPMGISWTGDRILFGDPVAGILEVPSSGGTPRVIVSANRAVGEYLHGPQLLPGGEAVLFTVGSAGAVVNRWSNAQIAVQSLKTGARKVVMQGGTDARYLPTGHLVFSRDGVLYANQFDLGKLEINGGPTAIVEGVGLSAGSLTGAAQFAVSDTGVLVYLPTGRAGALTTLVWRNRQGVDTPVQVPPHVYETPRISPDGTRVALHASDEDNDIWIFDVKSETLTRLTFDKASETSPLWTRDGTRVVYTSGRDGAPNLFWKAANGTGQAEPLMTPPATSNGALVANSISPDGKSLVYSVGVPADIMLLPLEGERRPRPLMAQSQFAERGGDVSPDGRWIAYYSDESGVFEVYVRPFPNVDSGRWQVSSEGGSLPVWSRDGTELFYIDARARLASVPVERGEAFSFGKATTVTDLSDSVAVYRNFDVTPDPKRFAVVKQQRSLGTPSFVVVEHWFEELKARVPVTK